jgi:hypothetical protein
VQHLYGAWPLHEINPEGRPDLARTARRALDLRGDENLSAHGSLRRALARTTIQITVGLTATTPTGTYRLVNRNSGKMLDVNGASTTDGASVIPWPPGTGANQEWQLIGL